MESDKVDIFYKEIIHLCNLRITQLEENSKLANTDRLGLADAVKNKDESRFSLAFDINSSDVSVTQFAHVKSQLSECQDNDLLVALRDEFDRQLQSHEAKQEQKNQLISIPCASVEHHFFEVKVDMENEEQVLRYCHFDGQKIARELFVQKGKPSLLLLAGKDDGEMCQWDLQEAVVAEDLGVKISESDFNKVWFEHGGFPYVRPTRKARRFLTSALFKKS